MTEKEKMLSGKLYDTSDNELEQLKDKCKTLCIEYNRTLYAEKEKRERILNELLGGHKKSHVFMMPIYFDYGCNTFIGKDFFSNFNLTILDCARIDIGDGVMIGPNVTIAAPLHPLVASERAIRRHLDGRIYDLEYAKPVKIGNNVWIASNVVINGGVNIGDNAVIGSGSVVTRDIPPNSLAVGNPCRVLREISDNDRIFGKLQ